MKTAIACVALAALTVGCAANSPASTAQAPVSSTVPPTAPWSAAPTPAPSPTPVEVATASPSPTPNASGVATRVAIPKLKIDLPVTTWNGVGPLPCDVAFYLAELHQPGQHAATYIFANARPGMFLPLLTASQTDDGKALIGLEVDIYTSADWLYRYRIDQVRPHQTDANDAVAAMTEQIWLQTGEGPMGTPGKLQVVALPLDAAPVAHARAHPKAHSAVCPAGGSPVGG